MAAARSRRGLLGDRDLAGVFMLVEIGDYDLGAQAIATALPMPLSPPVMMAQPL
jgi:hypothetical protein